MYILVINSYRLLCFHDIIMTKEDKDTPIKKTIQIKD
jgi:hypothetical protein